MKKIYSNTIPLKDIAWIDDHQGQIAKINIKPETTNEIAPIKEVTPKEKTTSC